MPRGIPALGFMGDGKVVHQEDFPLAHRLTPYAHVGDPVFKGLIHHGAVREGLARPGMDSHDGFAGIHETEEAVGALGHPHQLGQHQIMQFLVLQGRKGRELP